MKIDFTQELQAYRGIPILIREEPVEYATLKFAAIEALMVSSGRTLEAADILRRNDLARKIWQSKGEMDISVEDVALIKEMVPVRFKDAIMIAAPALELLDGGRV